MSDSEINFRQEDRDRGILTKSDRKYLVGEKDLSEQSQRDARYRIRNRLINGILDLSFLKFHLPERDRHQVAEKLFPPNDEGELRLLRPLSFLFRMLLDVEDDDLDAVTTRFEDDIEVAILRELRAMDDSRDFLPQVNVTIEATREKPDPDDLLIKYKAGRETFDELRYLRDHDYIEQDRQYYEHVVEHIWEEEGGIHLPGVEGVEFYGAADFDSKDEFLKIVLEAMENAGLIEEEK